MSHDHANDTPESGARLAIVVGLNFVITAAQIIGGLISGSLSLISDALHNFSDGIAVIIAWIAIRLDARPRTDHHTFGLKRAQERLLERFAINHTTLQIEPPNGQCVTAELA